MKLLFSLCLAGTIFAGAAQAQIKPVAPLRYAAVQPILSNKCFRCHGADAKARMANLRLDTADGAYAPYRGKRAIVPGKPLLSRAYLRMTEKNPALRMPPVASHLSLTPPEIALVRTWIEQGAKYEKHWSFIPPVRPAIPATSRPLWVKNPIDAYILARLDAEGLKPAPYASRETLIRRATLDLNGLPPTLQEVEAFVKDKSPNAYEKMIDRLLASPRFGERMAWDWLDIARYSDTNGFQEDRARPMWRWRDWAIQALNSNMPFDQFTVEQLAGDLLPNATLSQKIATGFNRNHMLNGEGGRIPEESRVEYVVDRLETTSTAWLGLTMGCARCHDHKYDPLSSKDFYSFYAFFNNVDESGAVDRNGSANPVIQVPSPEQEKQLAEFANALTDLKARRGAAKDATERDALKKQVAEKQQALDALNNAIPITMVMAERREVRKTFVLVRGDYDRYGEEVARATPAALPAFPKNAPLDRLGLAQWLISPENPLTARVTVNRLWQTLFGMGIVKTTEDFGIQGERPSHPELLDWLATEFVRTKWDVKRLIKLIAMSATYQQSSNATRALLEKDPENRLLAHAPRYRLPAPVLRDQALALSGLLVEKLGGAPVKPYQPEGVWEDFSYGKITYEQDHGESLYRRSLYTFWRRSVAPTTFFDTASRRVCTVRTTRTNTPLQALVLLNDTTFVEAARVFAERIIKEGGATPQERLRFAFRTATGRNPKPAELSVLLGNLNKGLARLQADGTAARKLLAIGEKKADATLSPVEVAAYAGVMSLILNLDEALSRE